MVAFVGKGVVPIGAKHAEHQAPAYSLKKARPTTFDTSAASKNS